MSESLVDMSCPIGIPGNIVNRKPFGRVPHSFASLKWEDENSMHLALSGSGCNEPQRCIIDRILLFLTVYVGRLADTPRNSESRKLAIGVLSDIIPDVRMGISPEGLPNSFGCIILFRRQSVSSLWFCKQWGRLRLRDCLAHRFVFQIRQGNSVHLRVSSLYSAALDLHPGKTALEREHACSTFSPGVNNLLK